MGQAEVDDQACQVATISDWQAIDAGDAASTIQVTRWQGAESHFVDDKLAQEVPIALIYNGISHVVMLATPADLEDFAYGFSYTEGIIHARNQIYGIEAKAVILPDGQLQGIELHIDLATAQFAALKEQRRNLTGRTGCGLCGAESLQQVFKTPLQPATKYPALSLQAISLAMTGLKSRQLLQQVTGATHACALADTHGHIVHVREDVGRHNALDKLIGALLRQGDDLQGLWAGHWVLTTSRASYEMVQKVAMTGGRALIAISAPTALAVNLARNFDFLLAGFAKPDQCVVYHGALARSE